MKDFWKKNWPLWVVYILSALVASVLKLIQPLNAEGYTAYENYRIFKNAPDNLLNFANPYAYYFNQTWDQYKYSPAFALGMAPFAQLPDAIGLPLWNLLNALVLLAAILRLPVMTAAQQRFMAWFVLLELLTSLQNSQSNGLTAGLFLWAFIAFERTQMMKASGWVVANGFIKLFGGAAVMMACIYPEKRRFLFWTVVWTTALTLVPLLFLSPVHTMKVYGWWWELLRGDHAASIGLSVQGWLESWFGWRPSKIGVTLVGLVVLAASILRISLKNVRSLKFEVRSLDESDPQLRTLAWASLLLWVVIFNHKAESPTFVIALCGVVLWYCVSEKKRWETTLLWSTFILVSLSPTDVFPRMLREQVVQPYVLKAVPCILLWGIISWKLLKRGSRG